MIDIKIIDISLSCITRQNLYRIAKWEFALKY